MVHSRILEMRVGARDGERENIRVQLCGLWEKDEGHSIEFFNGDLTTTILQILCVFNVITCG